MGVRDGVAAHSIWFFAQRFVWTWWISNVGWYGRNIVGSGDGVTGLCRGFARYACAPSDNGISRTRRRTTRIFAAVGRSVKAGMGYGAGIEGGTASGAGATGSRQNAVFR